MQKVFITRTIDTTSPFYRILKPKGFSVLGFSLVGFIPVPFSALPPSDWIFFYSKHAVRFFLRGLPAGHLPMDRRPRLAAFGPGTAHTLEKEGFPVDFTGDGRPDSTAAAFLRLAEGQRVLFPRAEHSRRSVQQELNGRIEAIDLVVYRNEPLGNVKLPEADYLVFTSPINARAYFSQKGLREGQLALAIGPTTAGTLAELEIREVHTAPAPSEEALAALVLELAGNKMNEP